MPKCKGRNCEVEMVHYHDGTEYRGTIWYKFIRNKNPRYGYWYPNMVKDPGALHKKK
ncbi:MAG: hypothetical protein NW207_07750 [Cytophagales bacterium]|nr:hypothetical protein [Cytophagales bacterium]